MIRFSFQKCDSSYGHTTVFSVIPHGWTFVWVFPGFHDKASVKTLRAESTHRLPLALAYVPPTGIAGTETWYIFNCLAPVGKLLSRKAVPICVPAIVDDCFLAFWFTKGHFYSQRFRSEEIFHGVQISFNPANIHGTPSIPQTWAPCHHMYHLSKFSQ